MYSFLFRRTALTHAPVLLVMGGKSGAKHTDSSVLVGYKSNCRDKRHPEITYMYVFFKLPSSPVKYRPFLWLVDVSVLNICVYVLRFWCSLALHAENTRPLLIGSPLEVCMAQRIAPQMTPTDISLYLCVSEHCVVFQLRSQIKAFGQVIDDVIAYLLNFILCMDELMHA